MRGKKMIVITLSAMLAVTAAFFAAHYLAGNYQMEMALGESEYKVNGKIRKMDSKKESLPFKDEKTGKLMLPLKIIAIDLGGKVEWNEKTKTADVTVGKTQMQLKAESKYARIDGWKITLDYPPTILNGTMYMPAEFYSNNFAVNVEWNDELNQITIMTDPTNRPVINFSTEEYHGGKMDFCVQTPVITNLVDANYERQLNKDLQKERKAMVSEFMQKVSKEDKEGSAGVSFWDSQYTIYKRTPEIISLLEEGTRSDANGKRENVKSALNIDLQTQRMLTLSMLFKDDSYQEIISEEMKSMQLDIGFDYDYFYQESYEEDFYIAGSNLVVFGKSSFSGDYAQYTLPLAAFDKILKDEYKYLLK
ncbi:MAG: hypothetical protein KHZ62_09090 [Clostridiales bacterium]|nr:hypothetical protein [Clostridiales bacterium]